MKNGNTVKYINSYVPVEPGIGTPGVTTLTASGDWGFAELWGGKGSIEDTISGYTMIVAPAAKLDGVHGGWNDGTGSATGNTVIIGSGATIGGNGVSGGTVDNGGANATGNTVELRGATVNSFVQGGRTGHNGSGDLVTGNTLILSGENTVNGIYGVLNFETIKLSAALEWNAGQTVLNSTSSRGENFTNENSSTKMTLDISEATKLQSATPGTMTLLSAGKTDAFADMPLKYFNNGTATLNTTGTEVFNGEATNEKNGVTLAYDATHTVKLEDSNKKVTYNVTAGPVKAVTLGEIAWDTSTAARTLTTEGLTFNGTTAIDACGLTFTGMGTATTDPIGQSMTLLAGATNITGDHIKPPTTTPTMTVDYTDAKGIKFDATASGTVGVDSGAVKYTFDAVAVSTVTLDSFTWGVTDTMPTTGWTASATTAIDATNFAYTGKATTALAKDQNVTILNATGLTTDSPVTGGTGKIVAIDYTDTKGIKFDATATGSVTTAANAVNYTVSSVALNKVNLANWNGTASAIPTGWTGSGVAVETGSFNAPTDLAVGESRDILTTETADFFNDNQITGALKYQLQTVTEPTATNGVTFSGNQERGVKAANDGKNLVYAAGNMDVKKISLGEMTWGTARDASAATYNYENANVDLSKFTFKNPETISAGTTTLLEANATLAEMAATENNVSYSYVPVAGVTMDGKILGSYASSGGNLTYTATANQATKLTFGDVAWKDSGALMTRPANIVFAGADVDTTHINFTNIQSLEANKKMTLVSDFGNSVGTITGAKYKVGTTLEGTGKASLSGSDLIFTAETGTTQEQTHNTVMGAEVGMAALSAGNDFVGAATEGLALASNVGADGVSSFAQMGGGSMRQETGSHVDTHTWNAILALGHQNKKERGTMEYGAFFEYGTGNYTTHNGDERGDGSTHYTGGGVLAKWTAKHGFYVEGSLRAGTVHDDARNVLRDGNGVPYSYETNAPYMGFHLGAGKEIAFDDMHAVDVYGRYFYNRRNSVSFDAGGHYDLDAVTSQTIRVGARYIVKRDKWNFYAGAAYEHELDGKASGKADGVEIRGADTSGASFRGEIGATMKPGENSPWSLDLNVTGFAGKKQGFTGGVSVAFMF